jgi:hypothetical protein
MTDKEAARQELFVQRQRRHGCRGNGE